LVAKKSSRCGAGSEIGGFQPFFPFGTLPALVLAWLSDGPAAGSGRKTMTFNSATARQVAVSLFAAVLTSAVFVSAAIGPVVQLA
jgi:uncharacterized protein (DUF2062 family)